MSQLYLWRQSSAANRLRGQSKNKAEGRKELHMMTNLKQQLDELATAKRRASVKTTLIQGAIFFADSCCDGVRARFSFDTAGLRRAYGMYHFAGMQHDEITAEINSLVQEITTELRDSLDAGHCFPGEVTPCR